MPRRYMLPLAVVLATTGSADPKDGGWRTLFDGTDLASWTSPAGGQPGRGWIVDDGTLVRKEPAGDLWTRDRFGDFVLDLEFQTTGNSGVFIRTDKPTDNVQTGLEIQIERPARPGKHSCGASTTPSRRTRRLRRWTGGTTSSSPPGGRRSLS